MNEKAASLSLFAPLPTASLRRLRRAHYHNGLILTLPPRSLALPPPCCGTLHLCLPPHRGSGACMHVPSLARPRKEIDIYT